jgi:starch-binding outer membrane protein, SusD/RagB family
MTTTPIHARLARSCRTALFGLVAGLAGCSTESLLEAPDPDLITPETVTSAEGANAVYIGALDRFRNITGGAESTWLFGGLLADEWSTSSTFIQNDETDQRRIQENNSSVTGMFRNLNRARTAANQAIAGLATYQPTRIAERAEMYFARGFAEMQLAQDFCNGIPLSDAAGPSLVYGTPLTVAEVFGVAIASYDSALALVTGRTDAASVRVERAARIGKARAQIGLGQQAAAATTLASGAAIATSYSYDHTFATTSGDNILWVQPFSAARYIVGDSLEGNPPTLLPVANAIGFSRAGDPRLPVAILTTRGQDGQTNIRRTTLWARSTSIPVVNGVDARMVEAEARLAANDRPGTLAILNALRAAPPTLGTVTPAAMPALADPGNQAAMVSLFFREKAFWTFSRGQRLGDLRRMIRSYGRTEANTFPTGNHYKGNTYGPDVNLPIPQDEKQNNPNSLGCTNRLP